MSIKYESVLICKKNEGEKVDLNAIPFKIQAADLVINFNTMSIIKNRYGATGKKLDPKAIIQLCFLTKSIKLFGF